MDVNARALQLVITADDLGIDPRRDAGIVETFLAGGITQASLLVAGPSAESAAREAERVGLPIGLHFDLTEMPCSAPRDRVGTLLDAHGAKRGKHGLRAALKNGEIDLAHVALEAAAQLDAFRAITGTIATHVDGHQHVHALVSVAEVIALVFAAKGVRTTRIPSQRSVEIPDATIGAFYRGVSDEAARAREIFARHGIATTDAFEGLDLMGDAASPASLRAAVERHLGTVSSLELMCHPGYAGHGIDTFNESPAREHEMRILVARPFDTLVRSGRVRLVPFERIASGANA